MRPTTRRPAPLLALVAAVAAGAFGLAAGCSGDDDAASDTAAPPLSEQATVAAPSSATVAPDVIATDTTSPPPPETETAPAADDASGAAATGTDAVAGAPATGAGASIPAIVARVQPSVVAILVEASQGRGEGSGVIWDDRGAIVTNNHVVEGATSVVVALTSGERLDATVVASDPVTDLAVVRVDRAGLPPASFAEDSPPLGSLAIALGDPLGFENSVTAGIVSGFHRSIPSGGQTPALVDLIQTDAAISPGNSGGALVGADGRVIGINVAYLPPGTGAVSLGFAIPAATVLDVVPQLLESGRVEHAFLGIQPLPLTPELARSYGLSTERGVIVGSVEAGSAAARAGLEPGDIVVRLGGDELATVEDLYAELRRHRPGDRVPRRSCATASRSTSSSSSTPGRRAADA
ncbi:MAG: trypsin-like peptidase domain-containing protein [Thermoleophilia bacterium]